jgi:hypothetical protein
MENDWSWYIRYDTERYLDTSTGYAKKGPPIPVLTGTNLEVNCRHGIIQLRRSPTGILLQEETCHLGSRNCSSSCSMLKGKSLNEIIDAAFDGKISRNTAIKALYKPEYPLKQMDIILKEEEEEED